MTTTEQQYSRFVKIIENAFEMKCMEILFENNCYDIEIDVDTESNCEKIKTIIDKLIDTISADPAYNNDWRRYTPLITPDIKQIILSEYVDRLDDVCYKNNFNLLKSFIYYYIVSNSHIVHNQIITIYKQLH